MRRTHCLWYKLNGHAARCRPPAGRPDPAPAGQPEVLTPHAHPHEEEPASDWESLWIDLGGEG
jgi:hypothetical protein